MISAAVGPCSNEITDLLVLSYWYTTCYESEADFETFQEPTLDCKPLLRLQDVLWLNRSAHPPDRP
jgi:hypothetical protein